MVMSICSKAFQKNYKVRLKRFTNEYDKPIRLYKLHGSVDTYIANVAHPNVDMTRIKRDWGVGEIQKEIIDEEGKHKYTSLFQNTHPDMLSGASSKAIWYKQPYYKELQEYFKENLEKSELLLVIGYGFSDDGINHIIENQFLISGKPLIIIDIARPNTRFIDDYNTTLIQKSMDDITYEEWMEIKKTAANN
ncbi:MAG: SIR2 family protein [Owenweeksia sp.]|nr:SIR2 family protein [Owenweeksia sp.]